MSSYRLFSFLGILLFTSSIFAQNVEVFSRFDKFEQKYLEVDGEKVHVVNFWATWCAPCIKELPYFEELNAITDDNIEVLLVSLDFEIHLDTRVKTLIENKSLQSKIVLLDDPNQNRWIDLVDPSWSGTIPATIFIKGDKKVFLEQEFHSLKELQDIISTL